MTSVKLVATLLTAISGYTGYAIPGELPRIVRLPQDILAQRVCGRPCRVVGFTSATGEIVLDEALAIGRDPVATSILVHELTHFLQLNAVPDPRPVDCATWNEREREAFEVQAHWLRDNSASIKAFSAEMARLNWGSLHAACADGAPPINRLLKP